MNKENCALKLVDEIILYYDARSKKHQNTKMRTDHILILNMMLPHTVVTRGDLLV